MDILDRVIKTGPYAYMTGREKFWMYVDVGPNDDCWEWQGKRYNNEYGDFRLFANSYLAHRLSYRIHNGFLPDNLSVCHTCDNPPCVNPYHLFLGTAFDNSMDMISKGRHNPCYGSRGRQSFLTEVEAAQIKWLAIFTPLQQKEIARMFNIPNHNTVSRIKSRARWPHINPLPVAKRNLAKLADRADRGVIGGSGDER